MSNQFESGIAEVVHEILLPPGEEIVDDNHAVAPRHQAIHEVAADESGAAGDHDAEALALQPEGDFAHRVDAEPGRHVAVLVHGSVGAGLSQLGRDVGGIVDRLGEEAEDESGDGNADEDEEEALLAEDVANGAGHAQPRLRRLREIGVAHRLRLVPAEYQLRTHFFPEIEPASKNGSVLRLVLNGERENEFFFCFFQPAGAWG